MEAVGALTALHCSPSSGPSNGRLGSYTRQVANNDEQGLE
jgi:hypothetical protein